jgi:hypothetical protein
MYAHFRTTVLDLPCRKNLFLQLTSSFKPDQFIDLLAGTYANIVSTIESDRLQHLNLDVCDLQELYPEESGGDYADDLRRIAAFIQLPKLRTLTVPQGTFFSVDEEFKTCELPKTIERIVIIDSTRATNRFANHILQNRTEWPDLTTIKLCLSRKIDHLTRDDRIVARAELPDDISVSSGNSSDIISDNTNDEEEAEEGYDGGEDGETNNGEEEEDISSDKEDDDEKRKAGVQHR